MDIGGFGKTFPHQYGSATNANFSNFLTFSPAGDELTLDFAKTVLNAEQLGQDDVTDFLAISFSSTDYIGHIFGPSSLEAEDNLLRLDRTLADLFAYVDKRVGLANTLIVLSADHGGPDVPGFLRSMGINSGYVSPDHWDKEPVIAALKEQFGIGQELILNFFPPYVYLDRKLIREKGLDQGKVEQRIATELMNVEGIALAVSSTAMQENHLPYTPLLRAALNNFNPQRSGDVLVLFQSHHFVNDFHGEIVAANHGGAWSYDTFVPVIFAGCGLNPVEVYRRVETVDVARTLSAWMGIKPPSGCVGKVLVEVLNGK